MSKNIGQFLKCSLIKKKKNKSFEVVHGKAIKERLEPFPVCNTTDSVFSADTYLEKANMIRCVIL